MNHTLELPTTLQTTKTPPKKKIFVFLAGTGAVGGTLLKMINSLNHPEIQFIITGLCNSRKLCWKPEQGNELDTLCNAHIETSWKDIIDRLKNHCKPLIFVDATGSKEVAKYYQPLLSHGIHIATPSKLANTSSQPYFNNLIRLSSNTNTHYKYETTVGAGLPVINTIQNLIDSGDRITGISGVVSGTMTYIFDQLQNGKPFSKIIRIAQKAGYTEPDPRDDLSGEDVARKFLILARTCGYNFEREDVLVESLVPQKLMALPLSNFLEQLQKYDEFWHRRNAEAKEKRLRLRYTGTFSENRIRVGIEEVPADSPLGGLKGTDNLIQIYSERYARTPIVIQGPGAGKEVTAGGILVDLISISKTI